MIPSLKYSWSCSGLMSANGRTASEGRGSFGVGVSQRRIGVRSRPRWLVVRRAVCRPAHQAPATSAATPTSARRPAGQRFEAGRATISSISPGAAGSVRCTPSGVTSNAQASTSASGKPSSRRPTMNGRKVSGSRSAPAEQVGHLEEAERHDAVHAPPP